VQVARHVDHQRPVEFFTDARPTHGPFSSFHTHAESNTVTPDVQILESQIAVCGIGEGGCRRIAKKMAELESLVYVNIVIRDDHTLKTMVAARSLALEDLSLR
jgi:hypothetical protein